LEGSHLEESGSSGCYFSLAKTNDAGRVL
jgi:hypothetical protein